ncbi:DNA-3-methyladenine glycosylase I [Saccharibacillus alkalitolerans]|uniref:DNA-3-methyladenine glycosylase I n=1 Tax=Saccharibacillus alkalitolerans TaxID=2705290 RepID=A0ABX0F571_9BACL|nr:DNA-3-methyladenine glycosylase I [Saccharibacillus alkalitolerans]NGZ74763.1 DNA-3-methyladenine glycosylase I [Saccharibacillus alkalitolerans]
MSELPVRCRWVNEDPLYIRYHDEEWGVPVHDDRKWFELLILEGAQAGLSWYTVLKKRERYREVMNGFDPEAVAGFDQRKIDEWMADPGIIRNRLKLEAAVKNAKAFLRVQEEFGTFDAYMWKFVDGVPIPGRRIRPEDVPARTEISDRLSKDLKKRGFGFVGSTICYALMQASGMVDDHLADCFRFGESCGMPASAQPRHAGESGPHRIG